MTALLDLATNLLRATPELLWIWRAILVGFLLYLAVLPIVVFLKPATALRFFDRFAGTYAINAIEAALRFAVGLALLAHSPESRFPELIGLFGAFMAVSALLLVLFANAHRRFARLVSKYMPRFVRIYALLSLSLCGLFVYVFSPIFTT